MDKKQLKELAMKAVNAFSEENYIKILMTYLDLLRRVKDLRLLEEKTFNRSDYTYIRTDNFDRLFPEGKEDNHV